MKLIKKIKEVKNKEKANKKNIDLPKTFKDLGINHGIHIFNLVRAPIFIYIFCLIACIDSFNKNE